MTNSDPYQIIKFQYVTEKARILENLKEATSNRSIARCESPKYVFIVDKRANKKQIAEAIEEIYSEPKVKVVAVNTINVKGKTRRVRGRKGRCPDKKKAIVTLEKGDSIENA